jgi:hypothetical protein
MKKTIAKISLALLAAIMLITAPACTPAPKKDEGVEAYKAAEWLKKEAGADPSQLAQLSNEEILEVYQAAQRGGERCFTTSRGREICFEKPSNTRSNGREIHTDPIWPIGPQQPLGPRKPDIKFDDAQLTAKFDKHAKDFGVYGTGTRANIQKFREAMESHLADPNTIVIEGTFRNIKVFHYVNNSTKLNVMKDANGYYLSGWKLNPTQFWNVWTRGSL